jgi:formamidopyrimidine-DNA glycosylase
MPELPEVETIARGVNQLLQGERIRAVWFSGKREPFRSPPQLMKKALPGKRIERVYRVGKHIVFDLGEEPFHPAPGARQPGEHSKKTPAQWVVHLGMTGRLLVADEERPLPPHTHGVLHLDSGKQLRFVDPRRFGRMALYGWPDGRAPRFAGPGREPLTISSDDFRQLFRGRRTSIKAALLNQKLLQGVGNIYADESLFRAGIRPRRMAARLKRDELERLRGSLASVLLEAISRGGSSVSDYVDATGEPGLFQLEHKVYMRTGQPCLVCGTPIRRVTVAGRGTHYCPDCQK